MAFSIEDDIETNVQGRSIPKHEQKARKSFTKLGLTQVDGVYRVVVRKSKQTAFVVSQPDVFKAPGADVYVVFGEARVDDAQDALQRAATEAFATQGNAITQPQPQVVKEEVEEVEEVEEDGEVDETGLDTEEIDAIVAQTGCSRFKAVKALREHENVVDALVSLADI